MIVSLWEKVWVPEVSESPPSLAVVGLCWVLYCVLKEIGDREIQRLLCFFTEVKTTDNIFLRVCVCFCVFVCFVHLGGARVCG